MNAPSVIVELRRARPADLECLLTIEAGAFDTDRLSARSFRKFVSSSTAILLVAELPDSQVVGYALVLFRRGTALARLYSIAVDPARAGRGIAHRLLVAAQDEAIAADMALMRLEVAEDNERARALYDANGFRLLRRLPGYYENGQSAVRLEKALRAPLASPVALPWYGQTTEFTCGPACLLMAMRWFDPAIETTPANEVRLWREATTIFMGTGLGGCEPRGMAVALADAGLDVTLTLSDTGPLLLNTVADPEKRRVMSLAQDDFRRRAEVHGIPVEGPLVAATLGPLLDGSTVAIVLISGNRMYGHRVPHWIVAHANVDGHILVHDPWVDPADHETASAAMHIPIPHAEFDRMSRYGKPPLRAALLVRDRQATPKRAPNSSADKA